MGPEQPQRIEFLSLPRLTLLGSQEAQLRQHLSGHPRHHEQAAVVFFRRLVFEHAELAGSDRFVAVDVWPLPAEAVLSSSPQHIKFDMRWMREAFRRCEDEGLVFCFAHSHPSAADAFSPIDDANELTLLKALSNRNGADVSFLSMLYCDGNWYARHRHGSDPERVRRVRHIAVLSDRIEMHDVRLLEHVDLSGNDSEWAKQAAAFGDPFVAKMMSLRVAVIGCSGTGSPTLTLLARSGTCEQIFIDPDALERPNLNRVRGARATDEGKNKADIAREYVRSLGLGTHIAAYTEELDLSPAAIDAIASCDVIFGCTDDQLGREAANSAAYYYALALIDVGLGGVVGTDAADRVRLTHHHGRISTVMPEFGDCLRCQRVVTSAGTARQQALRDDPHLTEEQLRERYLTGGGVQAPGVGPFTSAVADFSVATLYDLVQPFRNWANASHLRKDAFEVDFVKMELRSSQSRQDPECPYCALRIHTLRPGRLRIGRPSLGARRLDV